MYPTASSERTQGSRVHDTHKYVAHVRWPLPLLATIDSTYRVASCFTSVYASKRVRYLECFGK